MNAFIYLGLEIPLNTGENISHLNFKSNVPIFAITSQKMSRKSLKFKDRICVHFC